MNTTQTSNPETGETKRRVEFVRHAPDARSVFVAGSFNGWQTDAAPLSRGDDGTWRTSLDLAPGRRAMGA